MACQICAILFFDRSLDICINILSLVLYYILSSCIVSKNNFKELEKMYLYLDNILPFSHHSGPCVHIINYILKYLQLTIYITIMNYNYIHIGTHIILITELNDFSGFTNMFCIHFKCSLYHPISYEI